MVGVCLTCTSINQHQPASSRHSLTGGTAAATSCSDSRKYRPVLRTSTVAQLRRAPLEQRCFSGQWGSAPAAGVERRRLRCSIGVFCRPHRGAREPDFCRRVDTSLLPRSRSVPQAIWPRARKLAIGGKRRRSLPLAAWWWVLLAAAACCFLLALLRSTSLSLRSSDDGQQRIAAQPRATNHTAPEELPAGTGQSRPPEPPPPAIPRPNSSKVPVCKQSLIARRHPNWGPHHEPGWRLSFAGLLCSVQTAPHRTAPRLPAIL